MRKLLIAVVVAVVAMFAFTSVASAHTLRYSSAKALATKLAQQQETKHPIERWRIFNAERVSAHQIDWTYNVDYADGRLCDAVLVVRFATIKGKKVRQAFFHTASCERP